MTRKPMITILGVVGENPCRKDYVSAKHSLHLGISKFFHLFFFISNCRHNDHGSLTGLVPGLYLDSHGNALPGCPDPDAGLYIKSRNGSIHQICLPSDSLAFQVGETTQIHSGGLLHATPHAVRGCYSNKKVGGNITREALAIFMEPEYSDILDLPLGRTLQDLQTELAERNLPNTVKGLKSRYQTGMSFQNFSDATIAAFHQ